MLDLLTFWLTIRPGRAAPETSGTGKLKETVSLKETERVLLGWLRAVLAGRDTVRSAKETPAGMGGGGGMAHSSDCATAEDRREELPPVG